MSRTLTRSKDPSLNLAEIYVKSGFHSIPADENFIQEPDRSIINGLINMLWSDLEDKVQLKGRPSNKGTREPVVGAMVGADYRDLVKEYKESFGKKKVVHAKKVVPAKKVSASQKKSRADAKKAMNIMWKEGITLKQAWKKVKSGSKK